MSLFYGPKLTVVEVGFLAFHLSVTAFICCRRRVDSVLQNPFFTVYLVVSVGECVDTICVSLQLAENATSVWHNSVGHGDHGES